MLPFLSFFVRHTFRMFASPFALLFYVVWTKVHILRKNTESGMLICGELSLHCLKLPPYPVFSGWHTYILSTYFRCGYAGCLCKIDMVCNFSALIRLLQDCIGSQLCSDKFLELIMKVRTHCRNRYENNNSFPVNHKIAIFSRKIQNLNVA